MADKRRHDEEGPVVRRNMKRPLARNSFLPTLNMSFSLNLDRYSSASVCCLLLPAISFHCCMFVSNHSNHSRVVAQKISGLGDPVFARVRRGGACCRARIVFRGKVLLSRVTIENSATSNSYSEEHERVSILT